MSRKANLIDDLQIRRWIAAGDEVAKSDGEGLTFTLSSSGTATWILRYRLPGGRRREVTLGNYPDLGLAAARKLARTHRVAIDQGADPAAEKKAAKARSLEAWTVTQLVKDYREKVLGPPLAEGTIYYRNADIDSFVLPKLGSLEVRTVKSANIVLMIETSGRSWTVCKRALTSTSQLFEHAVGKRLIDSNPCAGVSLKAIKGTRPPVRRRVMLTAEELRALLADLDRKIGRENGLALRVLLATCVRSTELVMAEWQHVDFEKSTWWVPESSVKTRTGFLVPLTPTVLSWFESMKAIAGDSKWVLPARVSRQKSNVDEHVGRTTLWAALNRAFERADLDIRRFTPHDTRSTAKGHMRNMGVSNEISEIALNHKLKGMEAIYDVRQEIPERRAALELWADFIVSCALPTPC